MEQRFSRSGAVVVASSNAAYDGQLPWPRYPSYMAAAELPVLQAPVQLPQDIASSLEALYAKEPTADQVQVSYHLLGCIKRCEAVKMESWPLLASCATALASSLQAASTKHEQHNSEHQQAYAQNGDLSLIMNQHGSQQSRDVQMSTDGIQDSTALQPWAIAPAMHSDEAKPVQDQHAQECRTKPTPSSSDPYGDMTLSGRVRASSYSLRGTGSKTACLPPLSVTTAGSPLFRFIAFDPAKLEASDKAGSGGGMYHVKQPEWRNMVLTSGGLPELHECLRCWHNTRIMANLPIAKLQADVSSKASHWNVQFDKTFSAVIAGTCHAHGSNSETTPRGCSTDAHSTTPNVPPCSSRGCAHGCRTHCLMCATEQLATWLPAQLLTDPVQTLNAGAPSQVPTSSMPWSSATLSLRWWSEGSVEPLKCSSADKLLVQVCGSTRLLLVPPAYALQGLALFPVAHPYHGYSAPGIAITSRPTMPASNMHRDGPPNKAANCKTAADDEDADAECSHHGSLSLQGRIADKPAGKPSPAYFADAAHICDAVGQLWPEFLNVRGRATVLRAGDAIWIPAGWFVHMESLYHTKRYDHLTETTKLEKQNSISSAQTKQPMGKKKTCGSCDGCGTAQDCIGRASGAAEIQCNGVHDHRQPELPGNAMLEVELGNGVLGATPRALGALQLRCSNIIEEWAKAVTGSEAKVRPLLLDVADRLESVTFPGIGCCGEEPHYAEGKQRCTGHSVEQRQTQPVLHQAKTHSWVSFPQVNYSTTYEHKTISKPTSLTSDLVQFQQRHWALASDAATARASSIDPCWDVTTLSGYKNVAFVERVMKLLAPLIALEEIESRHTADVSSSGCAVDGGDEGCGRTGNMGAQCSENSWPVGTGTAHFLRAMCCGRLLPTTWLNKLMNNDLLLLKDVPYKYALEYKDDDEAQFPELFAPQLKRREKAARAAAQEAHIAKLRLTGSLHAVPQLPAAAEPLAS